MPCDERYWLPTVNSCIKELRLGSARVPVLSSTLQQSNINFKHLYIRDYNVKSYCNDSDLDDSDISLPIFPSRTNLKLHNISVTPKMVKKFITNRDSSKASGPDCISVVVLKNC